MIVIYMGSFDEFVAEKKIEKAEDAPHSQIDKVIEENSKKETVAPDEEIVNLEIVETPKEVEKKTYAEKVKEKMQTQKQKFKPEPEPEPELTTEEKEQIKKRFYKRIHINRREKKRIDAEETNPLLDKQKLVIGFGFIATVFLFLLWQYNPDNMGITTIIFLIGSFLFLPMGMILGWVFLDPFMRCKIMRKMSKGRKNFGIVNFVGKGKKIITRIKNFDEDLIWIKNKCWALTKSGIYELDKNGEQATEKRALNPDSFVTVTESVPTMFIDINSMQPLTFVETGREGIAPEELGSTLKGWVDNQMAKVMFLKRTLDIYFMIVIICAVGAAFFGYQNNQELMELKEAIERLSRQIQTLSFIKLF